MFWVMGGTTLLGALDAIFNHPATAWLCEQSRHSTWDQPHLLDFIFPLFLFIVGLVLPLSIDRQRQKDDSPARIHLKTLKRAAVLMVLGMLSKGLLSSFAIKFGVLSRIGFAYYVAALLVIYTGRRFQAAVTVAVLIVGSLAMTLIPIGPLDGAAYIHREIQNVLPATAEIVRWVLSVPSVLAGVLAGHYLGARHGGTRKALTLAVSGILCIGAGLALEPAVPRIFFLWTPSFVVYTAGVSLVLFAIFYWIIDVKGLRRWAFFFAVIGMNAVLIYFLRITPLIDFQAVADFFVLGVADRCGAFRELIRATGFMTVQWLMLYFLYKHNLFFKA